MHSKRPITTGWHALSRSPSWQEASSPKTACRKLPSSAEDVLSEIGASNPFVLALFGALSLVWGLSAMPLMASAFMMGDVCRAENASECTLTSWTITEEFGLHGSNAWLADFTTSSFLLGNVIGASFAGLSDRVGRRPVLIVSLFAVGVVGCLSSLSPEIYTLAAMRFVQGVFYTACGLANWVLAYESIPPGLRAYATLTFGLAWVLGYVAVAPLAYFVPYWRSLIIVTSFPCIVFAVAYYFIIPESFQFLVRKRRTGEVEKWVSTANRWALGSQSQVKINPALLNSENVGGGSVAETKSTWLLRHLLTDRTLFIYTAILAYSWATDTFVYFGLSLFSTVLDGNRYMNYVFSGIVEIPSYILAPFCLDRFGRRNFIAACQGVTAVCFLVLPLLETMNVWALSAWLVGKCAVSCAFLSLFVFASEVFPAAHRNGCIGVCEVVARLGGVFSPLLRTLGTEAPVAPPLLCGGSALIATLLTFVLPETSPSAERSPASEPEVRRASRVQRMRMLSTKMRAQH